MGLNLTRKYSINFSLPKRSKKQIKFLIIHYTGMIREAKAIKRLCDPKAKVSSHYFISNKGSILNLVPDLYEAWHAGDSRWKNYKSLNNNINSIECLGWAARSIKYRSNAYSQIADIFLKEKNFFKAIEYAEKSLEFNINNIPSLEIIVISKRYLERNIEHEKAIQKLEELDPINHLISFEKFLYHLLSTNSAISLPG